MVDFLFAIIELLSLPLTNETYKQILVEVGAFQRRWVTLNANFRWKGLSPPNHCCFQKTRVFGLPHDEDRMILSSFVSVQYQHAKDGQMAIMLCVNTKEGVLKLKNDSDRSLH